MLYEVFDTEGSNNVKFVDKLTGEFNMIIEEFVKRD